MFANSREFFREIDKFEADLQRKAEVAVRRTVKNLFNNIVNRTPVDTGYARSNWEWSTTRRRTATLPRPTKSDYGSPQPLYLTKVKFGDSVVIYNNTPYIDELENGWSGQAPQGMVAISMIDAEVQLQNEFRNI